MTTKTESIPDGTVTSPKGFVAGAVFSGFAMVQNVLIFIRKIFNYEHIITLDTLEKMNKVSMITDMSHWGEESSFDAIEASNKPLVISHAGARALVPKNRRLKSDELIIALAEAGGIVGVCGIPNYLAQTKRQGVKNMMDHIDHIVNLVGVNHVGIGTDNIFGDHAPLGAYYMKKMGMKIAAEYMEGIESLEEWPNIVRGLVLRGYSDQEIEKIIGGNALRVMDKVTK